MLGRLQVGGLDAQVFVNLEHSSIPYSVSLLPYCFINYLLSFIIILFLFLFLFTRLPFCFLVHT